MDTPDNCLILSFTSPVLFADWLQVHHASHTELWLRMYKKKSGHPTITWEQAVIEALCWGWIDGIRQSFDEVSFIQRFTPRRRRSLWSQRNREHAERLIAQGRMQEAGWQQVQAAQVDGRWASAYAPQSEMRIPEDFLAALDVDARAFFEQLNKSRQYAIAHGLATAKKADTRRNRFNKYLGMMQRGEKP